MHSTVVSENYSWSGMLTTMIKFQTVSILSIILFWEIPEKKSKMCKVNEGQARGDWKSVITKLRFSEIDFSLKHGATILRKYFKKY